jgi:hypothetical protein
VYVSDFPSATPLKPTVYVFVPLDNSFSRLWKGNTRDKDC